jgi:predicted nucleotidyltransferase
MRVVQHIKNGSTMPILPIDDCSTVGSGMAAINDERLLDRLATELSKVSGVRAIILGGSRARGDAGANSDYDIGLYYEHGDPLDIASLERAVAMLDDAGPTASVTAIGGWGPWINGGGWLTIGGTRVDLLYRDIDRVRSVIRDCREGRVERHYQPGHPHVFVSSIYMGEVAYCRPLFDPTGMMRSLREQTLPYPPALVAGLTQTFLWEAQFALDNARHGRAADDDIYMLGCCFRSVACLCQVLYAINGRYLLNEKGAIAGTPRLPRCPADFASRAKSALSDVGNGRGTSGLQQLEPLVKETESLSR